MEFPCAASTLFGAQDGFGLVNSKQGGFPCQQKHVALLSPVGRIEISGCETGVHEIKLPKMSVLPHPAVPPAPPNTLCEEEIPEPLQQCSAWLRAYFCEPASTATLPVPAFHHPLLQRDSFTRQVLWTLLNDVKFGEAVSYKQLADLAGNSRAARAVGGAMRSNPVSIPILIPCHRVIRSSGDTGNYGGGQLLKEWLLSHEKLQKEKLMCPGGGSSAALSCFYILQQNDYSDPGLLCMDFVPISSPVLFYF
uniref:Methylated-DNA--protein-cysteine methyltransferase n=1 Tax=Catharus ustulatus TaxID=91951 RepID=A0A8C3UFK6_CATUS